jgi:preprotein translocase subunit SecE
MTNPFLKVRDFLNEVMAELKKSSWPTRKELVDSTIVVIITVLVLGMFVALADVVFLRIIGFLTKTA